MLSILKANKDFDEGAVQFIEKSLGETSSLQALENVLPTAREGLDHGLVELGDKRASFAHGLKTIAVTNIDSNSGPGCVEVVRMVRPPPPFLFPP